MRKASLRAAAEKTTELHEPEPAPPLPRVTEEERLRVALLLTQRELAATRLGVVEADCARCEQELCAKYGVAQPMAILSDGTITTAAPAPTR